MPLTHALLGDTFRESGVAPPHPIFAARMTAMARALALWGAATNLTAHPEDASEIAFQIVDSLKPLTLVTQPGGPLDPSLFAASRRILDLGSGAGFPGLVAAAAFEARFVLVESRRKRAGYLKFAKARMGLHNVTVERIRAEGRSFIPEFDASMGRGLGDRERFLEISAGALKPGGVALLYMSRAQPVDAAEGEVFGLGFDGRIEYEVVHGARRIERAILLWRKP